jgi:hypothetical protein
MCRSPPRSIIVEMTMMPAMRPTPVMISMGDSNAYANYPPVLGDHTTHPEPRNWKPYVPAIKDA